MSIIFENVTKVFDTPVLKDLTLDFESGKITALLGASGRGKTTLLRLLAGLEKADKGTVKADGKIGYLFQEHRLLPTLNAYENVNAVSENGVSAKEALRLCMAENLADKMPLEMSGGERQRVALARLVAFGGDVWLLDEPFSALDTDTKEKVLENLLPLMKMRTVIMVTHSEEDANFADNVIKLK